MALLPQSQDLQAPLLSQSSKQPGPRPKSRNELHEEESPQGVGIVGGVSNLTKCIIGAGMLSLPRAFALLGCGTASIGLFGVSMLTVWTIKHGLVGPSVSWTGSLRLGTYSATVKHWLGNKAEKLLVFMMLLGGLGFEASCLDIIADILLGTPHNPGLLSTIVSWFCKCQLYAPHHPQPPSDPTPFNNLFSTSQPAATCALHSPGMGHFWLTPATETDAVFGQAASFSEPWDGGLLGKHSNSQTPSWVWLLDRRLVLLQVLLVVILPLSLKKHMGSLSIVNGVGLVSLFAFLVSVVWLAVAAVRQGVAHSLPWAPALKELGPNDALRALHAFGVLSVLLTATSCHGNIHPLMSIVTPFRPNTVNIIVIASLVICFGFYLTVSVCSLLVFGPNVQEDILTNLTVPAMSPLVGPWVAQAMALVLRLGYMVSVLGSAVLNMFPLRQAVADLLLGPPPSQADFVPSGPMNADHLTTPETTCLLPAPQAAYTSLTCAYAPSEADSSLGEPLIGTNAPDMLSGNSSPAFADWQRQDRDAFDNPAHHTVVLECELTGVDGRAWQAAVRQHAAWRGAMHAPLTVVLLLLAFVLAVTVPSIWVALSLVGSVSITCMSFMIPAAIGLVALRHVGQRGWFRNLSIRASLYLTAVLGALMFINGFVALYMDHTSKEAHTKD